MFFPSRLTRREMLASCAASGTGLVTGCTADSSSEFRPMFNGKDLSGWEGDSFLWVVEDGMLIGRSPGISYNDFLATTDSFGDFILRLRVHLVNGTGNSGVQFRSTRMPGSMEMIGYQADIGPGWWGNLYDESRRRRNLAEADPAVLERLLRPDDWNDYQIVAQGPRVQLTLNGETTVDFEEKDSGIARTGLIAVQVHSGPPLEVRFKDIEIKQL